MLPISRRFFVGLAFLAVMAATPVVGDPVRWRNEGWAKTDFTRSLIRWEEIVSGGPPKDGIPSIDAPKFKPVGEITALSPNEPVIGVKIGAEARAYPLRILIWHEIVNDTVGVVPIAVTYCPLCNSAVVFERRVGGRILDFGTTGKLRNSDLVMYDRQTESWWQQFTGEGIIGEFAGRELRMLSARLESFSEFRQREPGGLVLVPTDAGLRGYGRNPYVGYDSSAAPFLFSGDLPKDIEPLARVVVVRRAGQQPLIVALEHLRQRGSLAIEGIELAWTAGQSSAVDRAEIAKGRDVGTVTAVEIGEGGWRDAIYDVTFAFVAKAFHPGVDIIQK